MLSRIRWHVWTNLNQVLRSNKAVSAGASMASYMQRGKYANRKAIMSGNIEAGI